MFTSRARGNPSPFLLPTYSKTSFARAEDAGHGITRYPSLEKKAVARRRSPLNDELRILREVKVERALTIKRIGSTE